MAGGQDNSAGQGRNDDETSGILGIERPFYLQLNLGKSMVARHAINGINLPSVNGSRAANGFVQMVEEPESNKLFADVGKAAEQKAVEDLVEFILSLEWLHLEANSFEGEIPQSLKLMRGLRVLDLSHNNLSGLIPSYLGEFQLDMLNLSFNKLHGQVPIQGVFGNSGAISIVGNNDLCGGIAKLDLPPCSSSYSSKNKLSHRTKVILVVVGVVIFLSLLVSFFIFLQLYHVSKKVASSTPSIMHQFLRVSYANLLKATNGFSKANPIGVGSHASVYKGILDQYQMVVAVKVLNLQTGGASRSFMIECKALRAIKHGNLLKILSVCSSVDFHGNEFKALVYEFMANGNLCKCLHQVGVGDHRQLEEPRNFKLLKRLDISVDVASALECLHCGCESTIIHGDLKPSNVLLDDGMTAHIGDFGLAKIISTISSDVAQGQTNSNAIRGTIGYVAPEVWAAIKGCDGNKALGPDGFNLMFFQKCWPVFKNEFMRFFMKFHERAMLLKELNNSFVALIPKKENPTSLVDFRPISLIGSVYKILAKVLVARLKLVFPKIIGDVQLAFVGDRNIQDGVLIANEVVDDWKKRKKKGLILKLDFEKAYDSVN
ncbi:probable LRR receptor-like serine/threonine-protein kinase At3g47570 [Camellia sinensis]|uniref:probable LRR receptor-like serine/threonine-protein kinase At3g47570 n=1 Tax=Camellia sinensis TaxID=4442 RepID=UPI0010356B30|nr:probable LRR receptor-like serine/threonine-protein kinase At3g47570 [Camellia sinensis]